MSDETLLIDPPVEYGLTVESASTPARGTLPRLLAGIPPHGAMSLQEHLETHGVMPVEPRRRGWRAGRGKGESRLIEQLEEAGLRGQGGAGFPTGAKLRAVAEQGKRPVVVVNAAEGEPASLKDRTLMQALPHLVLDGAQLAAHAVGADELIVCVCESAPASGESAARAIAERGGEGGVGEEEATGGQREAPGGERRARSGRGSGPALEGDVASMLVSAVPGGYVAGQESALVNYLNGGPAKPAFVPPMVFEQGVRRRPTLVANAETLAHVALIARYGAEWYRELGMPSQPGSTLVTLAGAVRHPGVYEIEHGSALRSLIDAAGGLATAGASAGAGAGDGSGISNGAAGGISANDEPQALLVGGYAGSWIDGRLLRGVALSDEHLAPHGATLGAGVICVLSPEACPVAEVARLTRWMAGQSAGQCGPCVYGLDAIASAVEQIAAGHARYESPAHALGDVERLAALVTRRGACGHPDGVARMVASALQAFGPEWADHAVHGPCAGCAHAGELPLPTRPRAAAPVSGARRSGRPREPTREPTARGPATREPTARERTARGGVSRRRKR
jgi:NADH:ubiquinone oxidoreductase subunit F (NADH-binding)